MAGLDGNASDGVTLT